MGPRETLLAAARFQSPGRIPGIFWTWGPNDAGALDFVMRMVRIDATHERDEFGCVWETSPDRAIGFVVGNPLAAPGSLRAYRWPDPDDPSRLAELRARAAAIRAEGRAVYCNFLGLLWERLWFLMGLEGAFVAMYESPDLIAEILDRQADFVARLISNAQQACGGLLDAWCGTDDLGLQTGAFMPEAIFRRLFAPRYRRIFDACHRAGLLAYLHSDGRMNELIPALAESGLDILQVEDLRVKGIEALEAFRGRLAFQCTLDAQSTMPLGTREDIEAEAREIVTGLATPEGGLIASIYWDPAALGVDDERQLVGVRAFLDACAGGPRRGG
jgi:hypothetical protein